MDIDTALTEKGWAIAVTMWGAPQPHEDLFRAKVAAFTEKHHIQTRDLEIKMDPYQPPHERRFMLCAGDVDAALRVGLVTSGSDRAIGAWATDYNPSMCELGEDLDCTCSDGEDDYNEYETCTVCDYGSDYCHHHHTYH
jgi:hypothetical protein